MDRSGTSKHLQPAIPKFAHETVKDILYAKDRVMPSNILLNWILDLFPALTYLHENDSFHYDIKLEKILVDGRPRPRTLEHRR